MEDDGAEGDDLDDVSVSKLKTAKVSTLMKDRVTKEIKKCGSEWHIKAPTPLRSTCSLDVNAFYMKDLILWDP